MPNFLNLALDAATKASVDPTANISAESKAGIQAADRALLERLQQQKHGTATVTPNIVQAEVDKPALETLGSPEGLSQAGGLAALQGEASAALDDQYVPLTPEEAQAQYQQQLQDEARPRNVIREDTLSIPLGDIDLRKDDDVTAVSNLTRDVAVAENALVGTKGALSPSRAATPAPHFVALAELGLAQQGGRGGTGQWELKKGAGGVMYLATMIAISRLSGETNFDAVQSQIERGEKFTEKTGKVLAEQKDDAAKRTGFNPEDTIKQGSLARLIGQEVEQIMFPSGTINEQGEAQRTGYKSAKGLTSDQYAQIGNAAMTAFDQTGIVQQEGGGFGMTPYLTKRVWGEGGKTQVGYELTLEGWKMLADMSPVLNELAPDLRRPVSFTPLSEGHFVGEAAIGQQDITRTPKKGVSRVSKTMSRAAQVVGEMPNVVSDHKLGILQMMQADVLQAAKEGRESPFNVLFNQGQKARDKLVQKSHDSSIVKRDVFWNGEKWMGVKLEGDARLDYELQPFVAQQLENKYEGKEKPSEPVREAIVSNKRQQDREGHEQYANKVQASALDRLNKTIQQAQAARGKAFYYGSTFIGNSSRMMITQTDLNWQSSKLARFMVDNPRASKVTKGSKSERSFKYVVARAVMKGADLLTPDALIRQFDDNAAGIGPIADAFYQAAQTNNPQLMGEAMRMAKESGFLADEWEPTGEWGFVLDGLHEWGKWRAHDQSQPFYTRVKAEVDGINNGSSIQGLQFGSEMILERAGVLYNSDNKVLDDGNMRDYLFGEIGKLVDTGVLEDPTLNDAARKLYAVIDSDPEGEGLKKKLIKIPLMTTIYGMPADGHGEHVGTFVAEFADTLLGPGASIEAKQEASKILSQLVERGLRTSLTTPLLHQDVIKHTAGWLFNIANIIPEIEGPNGYVFQSGGVEYFDPAEGGATTSVSYRELTPEGEAIKGTKEAELTTQKVGRGTATAPKAGRRAGDAPRIGAVTRNQLAVSGTHNIDSTIAQETLIAAREEIGPSFWGQQVFDAFIGDVSSLEQLIDIGNKKFLEINRRYNMYKAEQDAYNRMKEQLAEKVKQDPNADWSVGPDGFYKGVYEMARQVANKRKRWGDNYDKMKQQMEALGFSWEKGSLKGWPSTLKAHEVKAIFDMTDRWLLTPNPDVGQGDASSASGVPIGQAFSSAIRETEAARKKFEERYKYQKGSVRQYN